PAIGFGIYLYPNAVGPGFIKSMFGFGFFGGFPISEIPQVRFAGRTVVGELNGVAGTFVIEWWNVCQSQALAVVYGKLKVPVVCSDQPSVSEGANPYGNIVAAGIQM